MASGNTFFIYFSDISASDSFFSSSGNVFLNAFRLVGRDFMASGNTFFIYF